MGTALPSEAAVTPPKALLELSVLCHPWCCQAGSDAQVSHPGQCSRTEAARMLPPLSNSSAFCCLLLLDKSDGHSGHSQAPDTARAGTLVLGSGPSAPRNARGPSSSGDARSRLGSKDLCSRARTCGRAQEAWLLLFGYYGRLRQPPCCQHLSGWFWVPRPGPICLSSGVWASSEPVSGKRDLHSGHRFGTAVSPGGSGQSRCGSRSHPFGAAHVSRGWSCACSPSRASPGPLCSVLWGAHFPPHPHPLVSRREGGGENPRYFRQHLSLWLVSVVPVPRDSPSLVVPSPPGQAWLCCQFLSGSFRYWTLVTLPVLCVSPA